MWKVIVTYPDMLVETFVCNNLFEAIEKVLFTHCKTVVIEKFA